MCQRKMTAKKEKYDEVNFGSWRSGYAGSSIAKREKFVCSVLSQSAYNHLPGVGSVTQGGV